MFESNKVEGGILFKSKGGAAYALRKNVVVTNSTFKDKYASCYGGAIFSAGDTIIKDDQNSRSFFINNVADDYDGGAIYCEKNANINNAIFSNNKAYIDGGAIFCCDNAYVTHCLFDSNRAEGSIIYQCEGGAIHCKDDLTVDNCTFKNNFAQDYGGAIYADTVALKATPSYFELNTACDNQGGAIWTNKFREDVKYATFINNNAGQGANDDDGAIYIDDENWITFSQCVFVTNHCGDEGGAIYLDSQYSHLTLKNNIFLGNTAANEGQIVFNKGYYDAVTDNWWGDNLPNQYNDLLVEWKATIFQSNVHHADSHPVYLKLKLIPGVCNAGESVWAQACFYHYNDGSLCNGEMNTEYISLIPTPNISFYNRVDHGYYVNTRALAQEPGTYSITANLFGQFSSATLTVNQKTLFESSNNKNNPDIVSYEKDDKEIVSNLLTRVVAEYNMLTGGSDLQYEDSNTSINNESNTNSSSIKSINQPKTVLSNNNIYLILFVILLIALAGYGIKKYRG